jgi:membrane-associated phospholipid phosphatase
VLFAAAPGGNPVDDRIANALTAPDDSMRYRWAGHLSALGSVGAVVLAAVVLAGVCWWRTHDLRLTLLCVLAPGLAGLAQGALKEVVDRRAPGEHVPASALTFPSGHATGVWAVAVTATVVAVLALRAGWVRRIVVFGAFTGAIAVSIARVVVGDHYASDVAAGALLGTAVALALTALLASGDPRPSDPQRRAVTSASDSTRRPSTRR